MHPSLEYTHHRPWSLPEQPWVWRQSWLDLCFLHWPVPKEPITSRLPSGLEVDTFDGHAWLGVVPFMMSGVMKRPFPDLPGFSRFPELNLRTYVRYKDRPGVWFFSLDAASRLVVLGGRHLYGLPYHHASIQLKQEQGAFCFNSRRSGSKQVDFSAQYKSTSDAFLAEAGTFEHWATERYCLYSQKGNKLYRVEVHHVQWPLMQAQVEIASNDLFTAAALAVPEQRPICHFSTGVDVVSYRPERIDR